MSLNGEKKPFQSRTFDLKNKKNILCRTYSHGFIRQRIQKRHSLWLDYKSSERDTITPEPTCRLSAWLPELTSLFHQLGNNKQDFSCCREAVKWYCSLYCTADARWTISFFPLLVLFLLGARSHSSPLSHLLTHTLSPFLFLFFLSINSLHTAMPFYEKKPATLFLLYPSVNFEFFLITLFNGHE